MKNTYLLIAALALLAGCAMRTKILDAPAISMTQMNVPAGEKLQETGPVTGKFCPDSMNDKGTIGLLDESVKAAQAQSGVDWILNASFYMEGNCIDVEGTGAKLMASNAAAPAAGAVAPMGKQPKAKTTH